MAVASAAGTAFLGRFETKKCRALYPGLPRTGAARRAAASKQTRRLAASRLQISSLVSAACRACTWTIHASSTRFAAWPRTTTCSSLTHSEQQRAAKRTRARREGRSTQSRRSSKRPRARWSCCRTRRRSHSRSPRSTPRGGRARQLSNLRRLRRSAALGLRRRATVARNPDQGTQWTVRRSVRHRHHRHRERWRGRAGGGRTGRHKRRTDSAFSAKCDAVVAFLKSRPGATTRALRDATKCNATSMAKVTDILVRNGIIEDRSTQGSPVWHFRGVGRGHVAGH